MDMSDDLGLLFDKLQLEARDSDVDEIPEGWFSAFDMQERTKKSMTTVRDLINSGVSNGILEFKKLKVSGIGRKVNRTYYHEKDNSDRKENGKRGSGRNADRK